MVSVKSGLPTLASAACINFLFPSSEKLLYLTLQWKRKQKCNYDTEVVHKSYEYVSCVTEKACVAEAANAPPPPLPPPPQSYLVGGGGGGQKP